jgi:hypothetical protein
VPIFFIPDGEPLAISSNVQASSDDNQAPPAVSKSSSIRLPQLL